MSERRRSSKGIKAGVTSLVAAAALLAGCSSNTSSEPVPNAIVQIPTATPETNPQQAALNYEKSARRNHTIAAAVMGFGQKVLEASKNSENTWAPFDAYCYQTSTGQQGWKSQGYVPKPGDTCNVQHNPQYGGEDMQVGADTLVDNEGQYTDNFSGVFIDKNGCDGFAQANYYVSTHEWSTTYSAEGGEMVSSDTAKTPSAIQQVDNFVLNCLNQATYK